MKRMLAAAAVIALFAGTALAWIPASKAGDSISADTDAAFCPGRRGARLLGGGGQGT